VTGVLESLAGYLISLPDESVEGLLSTFDAVVNASSETQRPPAAELLRRTAHSSPDPARRDRLLRAADAIAAGQPAATPGAETYSSTENVEWKEAEPVASEPEDFDDREEEDEDPHMNEEPPQLPHLPVRHFFGGLVVRIGRDFADSQGRAVCRTDLLKLLVNEPSGDGFTLAFVERTVRLSNGTAGHGEIIENAGNAWFQPVPSRECLEELVDAIELGLDEAEADEELDADDLETIRDDIEKCREWIAAPGNEAAKAPRCQSDRLAVKLFGAGHEMAAWITLLFAAAGQ